MTVTETRLRTMRVAAAIVVLVAFAGLATMAVLTATVTRRTSVPTSSASGEPAEQQVQLGVSAAAPSTPATTSTTTTTIPVAPRGRPPTTTTSTTTSTTSTTTTPPGTLPSPPQVAACPLGLPPATQSGGLQSLIGLEPLFGPFAAEAFAMAPAFQPLLQLLGPVLAEYPGLSTQLQPVLGPLLADWEVLANAGNAVILPLYGPYQRQFLEYETQFAALIAPYAEKAAGSPWAACAVDLEGELTSAAR
jgi:hypothetical protein